MKLINKSVNLPFTSLLCQNIPLSTVFSSKGKGKALPRTGHEGPEGEQMYSSTLSSTLTPEGSTPRPGHFNPEKDPVPIV